MTVTPSRVHAPASLVLLFVLAAVGITLVAVDVANGRTDDFTTDFADTAAVMLTVGAPILIGVIAVEFDPAVRGGAWTALGVLLIGLGVLTLISGFGIVLILFGGFLLAMGVGTGGPTRAVFRTWLLSLSAMLVAGGLSVFGVWFQWTESATFVGELLIASAWVAAVLVLRALDRRMVGR